MFKKLLILFMALCLLPLAASAQEEAPFVRTASFAIPSLWGGQYASLPLDERWFASDPASYHHGLARISLAMAVSAFRSKANQPDAPIRSFFSQLGFAESTGRAGLPALCTWDFSAASSDTVGTAIAWRYINCFEAPVPLIAVAVSGGDYGGEWHSNLNLGLSGDHHGFSRAADRVLERIAEFEIAQGLDGESCVYWLSGFGRGGAVCNLAAAKLSRLGAVFCYTFASPRTTVSSLGKSMPGIFNIVSAADPICRLPFAAWGFSRFGRDVYLPSSRGNHPDYAALLAQYSHVFYQFSGQTDAAGDMGLSIMADAAEQALLDAASSREAFQNNDRPALSSLLSGQTPLSKGGLRVLSLLNKLSAAVRPYRSYPLPPSPAGASLGILTSKELAVLYAQHDPAVYASWLLALPGGEEIEKSSLSSPAFSR